MYNSSKQPWDLSVASMSRLHGLALIVSPLAWFRLFFKILPPVKNGQQITQNTNVTSPALTR
jgi:hypothetical protein